MRSSEASGVPLYNAPPPFSTDAGNQHVPAVNLSRPLARRDGSLEVVRSDREPDETSQEPASLHVAENDLQIGVDGRIFQQRTDRASSVLEVVSDGA